MDPSKLTPANISQDELPSGFTAAAGGGGGTEDPKLSEKEAQKESILAQALTSEALARLRRIKLVKPEKTAALENLIVAMAMQGKLPGRINEGRLIEMLEGVSKQSGPAAKINIQRKKYAFDSDDEDDNDDDLM
mmetsp:Transcript_31498/g.44708  ORF Transcript_31498/g.44708 Transcript_31498/m.44708 type:complete len:134 (+) Transcript_31498:61-462(+)